MGMSGLYIALEEPVLRQVIEDEIDLHDIDPSEGDNLDIDKTWQAIYFILCGEMGVGEPPLGYVVPMLDDQMLSFGEMGSFYVLPDQVAEAAAAIASLKEEDVRSLYRFEDMVASEIYPIVSDENEQEFF